VEIYQQLRQARKARGLDLNALEEKTRVRVHLLRALETGRFEELPSGVYARAVVRAYASAVGLNAEEVLSELAPQLPGVEDPIDGLARVRGVVRKAPRAADAAAMPEVLAVTPATRVAMASALDGAILGTIDLFVLASSAGMCGVSIERLLAQAAPVMLALWALIATMYFLMFAGLAGTTPGTWIAGTAPSGRPRRVDVALARRRAGEFALREASILVELLASTDTWQQCLRPRSSASQ
jgi:uncharacterized RDD family membrane protein YckC